MESTGIYYKPMAKYLHDAGIYVSMVNPKEMHGYDKDPLRKVKTEKADAKKIAKYGLAKWEELREYIPEDDMRQTLKSYSRQYETAKVGATAYVLVAVGTYTTSGSPFSLANNVTVIGGFDGTESGIVPTYSQDGDATNGATNTIFSGGKVTKVFSHTGGLNSSAVLENVVIANGKPPTDDYFGGGMYNDSSSPTLTNCTFTGNTASSGGGMYSYLKTNLLMI